MLSVTPSRDDLIVRLLSDAGELTAAVAPQARRATRRGDAGAVLQPLSAIHLTVSEAEGRLPRVEAAAPREAFLALKSDPEKVAAAMCMVEAILHLVPEGATEPELPPLLSRALGRLDASPPASAADLLALFLLRLLALSGLLPELGPEVALPPAALPTLQAWQSGRFQPLPPEASRLTLRWFEQQISEASLRPFRSLGVYESLRGDLAR